MKCNTTYRLIALSLAFLMLMTSVSFGLDMHYCKGEFKSFSFIEKAKTCHETTTKKTCPHHQKLKEDKSCCENKTIQVKANDDLQTATLDLPIFNRIQSFVIPLTSIVQEITFGNTTRIICFPNDLKLNLTRDIYVLFETFLL